MRVDRLANAQEEGRHRSADASVIGAADDALLSAAERVVASIAAAGAFGALVCAGRAGCGKQPSPGAMAGLSSLQAMCFGAGERQRSTDSRDASGNKKPPDRWIWRFVIKPLAVTYSRMA